MGPIRPEARQHHDRTGEQATDHQNPAAHPALVFARTTGNERLPWPPGGVSSLQALDECGSQFLFVGRTELIERRERHAEVFREARRAWWHRRDPLYGC